MLLKKLAMMKMMKLVNEKSEKKAAIYPWPEQQTSYLDLYWVY
jgi:hypothetical protein